MSESEQRSHCQAMTKAGRPCKNYALAGSTYCAVHQSVNSEQLSVASNQLSVTSNQIPVTNEQPPAPEASGRELREQLMVELDELIKRLQAMTPGYTPPPFSPRGLLELIEKNAQRLSAADRLGILQKMRGAITQDVFDVETWKGLWYMLNYTLQSQADVVKRRFTGEYEVDEWGLDWEFLDTVRPFFTFLYKLYWRVSTTGVGNIPDSGRGLLVANHSGQLPWDAAMIGTAVLSEHPAQRLVRSLYGAWFPTLPFFSLIFDKMGHALATMENGTRLLQQDEIVAVYPEGYKGVGKLFRDRYKLARFGRGGFVKMALATQSPIIPTAVVGAEETYVSLAKSDSLARLTGFPYFPLSPTFPWLGPLGLIPLPTKWSIDFGEPIPTDVVEPDAANNLTLVNQLTEQVRDTVQAMVNQRLAQRRSVFLG